MKLKYLLRWVWLLLPIAIFIVFLANSKKPLVLDQAGQIVVVNHGSPYANETPGNAHSCAAGCQGHGANASASGQKVAENTKLPKLD